MKLEQFALNSLLEARAAVDSVLGNPALLATIAEAGTKLSESLRSGYRIYSCGNGGSMCDAIHFAEELSGRYRKDRPALGAAAISDVAHMTCVANDYGYEHVFSRYIEGHGRPGDVLLAISTSGASKSIINAANMAKSRDMTVIGLHGRTESELSRISDYSICTPAGNFADRIQECHIKILHILIELVERSLFPANYDK